MKFGAPKRFIGHPIAYARKTCLQKESAFNRQARVFAEKLAQTIESELGRIGTGWELQPKRSRRWAVVKPDLSKETGIRKDQ